MRYALRILVGLALLAFLPQAALGSDPEIGRLVLVTATQDQFFEGDGK